MTNHTFHWKHDPKMDIWTKGRLRVTGTLLRQLGKPIWCRKMKTLTRLASVVSRPRPARPALTKETKRRIGERIKRGLNHV